MTAILETTPADLAAMAGPFEVRLGNLDFPKEAYWTAPLATLAEAAAAVRAYIQANGLGSSDWDGGELRRDGKLCGRVSYNGSLRSVTELRAAGVRGW